MKKKFLIYFIGNFGSKFLNLLIIPIFTIYISAKDFGEYDYWMTISNLLIIFLGMNFQDAAYMNILKERNENSNNLNEIVTKLIKTVFYQSVTIVSLYFLSLIIYGFNLYILLLSILILINNLHSFFSQGIARGFEKNKIMAISSIILSIGTIFSTLIFILVNEYFNDYFEYVFLLLLSQIIGYLFSVIYLMIFIKKIIDIRHLVKQKLSFSEVSSWIKFSFPLVINSLSWWIIYLSSRIIIVNFLGESQNGIFSIANRFPSVIFMLNTIFTLVWQDYAISINGKVGNNKIYNKYLIKFSHVQFISLLSIAIVFYYIAPLIVRNEYAQGIVYVPLLMYGTVLSGFSSFYSAFYFSTGKSIGAIPSSIISAIVFIVITLSLIDHLELYGVVIATIASYIVMLIWRSNEFKKKLQIKFPWKINIIYSLCFFIMYYVLYN